MIPQRQQQTAQTSLRLRGKTRPDAHTVFNNAVNVTGHLSLDFKQNSIERKIH